MSNYKEIELMFGNLLSQPASNLSNAEIEEVREFLDAGEYGIALRTFVAIFGEEYKIPTPAEFDIVKQLALAMCIDPDTLLAKMTR